MYYKYTYPVGPWGAPFRRVRNAKRKLRAKRNPAPVEAKLGTRPLSKMSNLHPVQRYAPGDPRRDNYNRRLFV